LIKTCVSDENGSLKQRLRQSIGMLCHLFSKYDIFSRSVRKQLIRTYNANIKFANIIKFYRENPKSRAYILIIKRFQQI